MCLTKGQPGENWRRLFRGDPDGARCMEPPYRITGRLGPTRWCQMQAVHPLPVKLMPVKVVFMSAAQASDTLLCQLCLQSCMMM